MQEKDEEEEKEALPKKKKMMKKKENRTGGNVSVLFSHSWILVLYLGTDSKPYGILIQKRGKKPKF